MTIAHCELDTLTFMLPRFTVTKYMLYSIACANSTKYKKKN